MVVGGCFNFCFGGSKGLRSDGSAGIKQILKYLKNRSFKKTCFVVEQIGSSMAVLISWMTVLSISLQAWKMTMLSSYCCLAVAICAAVDSAKSASTRMTGRSKGTPEGRPDCRQERCKLVQGVLGSHHREWIEWTRRWLYILLRVLQDLCKSDRH
jgi:hypothetical protein